MPTTVSARTIEVMELVVRIVLHRTLFMRYRFPIYNEGAALSRREEVVDPVGPPSDFVDIDLLPLKEPEVKRRVLHSTPAKYLG